MPMRIVVTGSFVSLKKNPTSLFGTTYIILAKLMPEINVEDNCGGTIY